MAYLTALRVNKLRTLQGVDYAPDARANLISGHNGAGKTTLLEAIYLLSRGRSFRSGDLRQLVAHGAESATVAAEVAVPHGSRRLAVTVEGRHATARVDGEKGIRRPVIVRILPVLNLDARLMDLVDRGPERRRLLLNWVAFHVEPAFNAAWRRFRRVLKQRNASLRASARQSAMAAWDGEFCRAAGEIEELRRKVAERLQPRFVKIAGELTGLPAEWDYYPGWPREDELQDILKAGLEGDRRQGNTRFGPQRADLILRLESRRARYLASRGQQKLLAASLMLASAELLQEAGVNRPVLLADEPIVELDDRHAEKLVRALHAAGTQLFITAVDAGPYRDLIDAREIGLKEGALV